MFCFALWFGMLPRLFRARRSPLLENLALRQQLVALKRRHPRPSLGLFDKLFWVVARRLWSGWKQSLMIVTPETVVRWHRAGFRLYWKLVSRGPEAGWQKANPQVRDLIFRMVAENPTWGAPRIHGARCNLGARHRWGIEEGILVEKHQGYGYEHGFSYNWEATRGYHFLMQIARLLNVLVEYSAHLVRWFAAGGCAIGLVQFLRTTCSGPWLDAPRLRQILASPCQIRLE